MAICSAAAERSLGQMPVQEALSELKALLEDPAVLKIGQNLKYDMLVLAQPRHLDCESFDDTMLLSYVLDAGAGGHGMDALGALAWPQADCLQGRDRLGQERDPVCQVPIDKATAYAAEDADITLRLWHDPQGHGWCRQGDKRLRAARAPAGCRC
jgi:DNA polymerase-1